MGDSREQQQQQNSRRVKKWMTGSAFLIVFMFGLMNSLINPVRYDVVDQLHSSLKDVSYGPMARASGIGIGSLAISFALKRVRRQTADIIVLTAAGLTCLSLPFTRKLWQYLLTEVLTGTVNAMHGNNRNSWLLEMWGSGANPVMQALHALFAVGATAAPLLVAPFLSDRNSTRAYERESHIVIPYSAIAGSVLCVTAFVTLLYYKMPYIDSDRKISKRKEEKKKITKEDKQKIIVPDGAEDNRENNNEIIISKSFEASGAQTLVYNRLLIGLSCVFVGSYVGVELSSLGFSAAFLYCLPLGFTKVDAAHIASAMNASFAVNRLISIYVATKISARNMLIGSFIVLVIGCILLLSFGNSSQTMVWIAFTIIGKGHSNVYPAFLSFVEQRVNVTAGVMAAFSLSSCAASLIFPVLVGQWLEEFPFVYVIVSLSGLTVSAIAFIGILCLDRKCCPKSLYESIN